MSVGIYAATAVAIWLTWTNLATYPRTTDAFVRADIIGIASHVSGNIIELNVVDNQRVQAGDVLFVVDPRPYEAELAQVEAALAMTDLDIDASRRAVEAAKAAVEEALAQETYAVDHLARLEPLLERQFVTPDEVEKARSTALSAQAALRKAKADLERAERLTGDVDQTNVRMLDAQAAVAQAQLNVDYCTVRAPVDGYITNLNIARGEYANLGQQVFALVDDAQWYVLANFRETLLEGIKPGMSAEVWLLSCPDSPVRGIVQGVGKAIYQPVGASVDALADVPPTLDWVRLAQRFPVRITLETPQTCQFHSGSTATVIVRGFQDAQ